METGRESKQKGYRWWKGAINGNGRSGGIVKAEELESSKILVWGKTSLYKKYDVHASSYNRQGNMEQINLETVNGLGSSINGRVITS
jgi:hypothetical protein